MKEKDLVILSLLRTNARKSLAVMSRETNIPISTIFDRLRRLENNLIIKHTSLIDFSKVGYPIRVNFIVKSKDKQKLKDFLLNNKNVNSIHKINNYDFFVDVLFKDMKHLSDFEEQLEQYSEKTEKFHVIEELKEEGFGIFTE